MAVPVNLLRELEAAWHGPPPKLPIKWASKTKSETHDAYVIFNSMGWQDVRCENLITYFLPLTLFLGTNDRRWPEVGANYLASYIRCFFCIDLDKREFTEENIEYYLLDVLGNPQSNSMPLRQCEVVEQFLRLTDGLCYWMEEGLPERRHRLVTAMPASDA